MALSRTARAALTAAAFTAGLTAAAGPGFAVAAVEKMQDVVVRNTDDSPIPTKAIGTTKVDATGQTLTINGAVEVTNQPAAAVTRPFQENVFVRRGTLASGENRAGRREFETLAADERLTITYWSGSSDEAITDVKLAASCSTDFTILHADLGGPAAPGGRTTFSTPVTFQVPPKACVSVEVFWRDHLAAGEPDLAYPVFVSGYITKVG